MPSSTCISHEKPSISDLINSWIRSLSRFRRTNTKTRDAYKLLNYQVTLFADHGDLTENADENL